MINKIKTNCVNKLTKQKEPFKAVCFHTGETIASSYKRADVCNSINKLGYKKVDIADYWYRKKPTSRTIIVKKQW
tara:strand:+ start:135 stop:359 length:225 start_codon:yes stop_codon:yes gene_type:complete